MWCNNETLFWTKVGEICKWKYIFYFKTVKKLIYLVRILFLYIHLEYYLVRHFYKARIWKFSVTYKLVTCNMKLVTFSKYPKMNRSFYPFEYSLIFVATTHNFFLYLMKFIILLNTNIWLQQNINWIALIYCDTCMT